MTKLTMSVPEAAKAIGVSKDKMYVIARSQGFPCIKVGKRVLVSIKGFERWVEEQAAKGYGSPVI